MERTGNKFNDLYALRHKIDFIKPRRDKSAVEIEFEQQKAECSFKPNRLLASQVSKGDTSIASKS